MAGHKTAQQKRNEGKTHDMIGPGDNLHAAALLVSIRIEGGGRG